MMFYEGHTLQDSKTPLITGGCGFFKAPSIKQVLDLFEKYKNQSSFYEYIKSNTYKIIDCKYVFKNENQSKVHITLEITFLYENRPIKQILASAYLHTIQSNCGALLITDFGSSIPKSGFGTIVLTEIINWTKYTGYTFLLGNTAGTQNKNIPFFQKFGFKTMGPRYINSRSHNENIWICLILNDQEELRARINKENHDWDENENDDEYDNEIPF